MFEPFEETRKINQLISLGGYTGMTEKQFFEQQIRIWLGSKEREEQLTGERYYVGEQDILQRKRTAIGRNGELEEVKNLPNNQIVDNQYAKAVDQKVNYLVGKPFTIKSQNERYVQNLSEIFSSSFYRKLHNVCQDSINGGIGWFYFYYDEQGKPAFKRIPPFQLLPFWSDEEHTQLDCAVRIYPTEVWEGFTQKIILRVEIYKTDGVWRYLYDSGELIPDTETGDHESYITAADAKGKSTGYNWLKIPLIPFKFNAKEIPLIRRVKSLQDSINIILSEWANRMEEDPRKSIIVLTEYDGQDLGEFRKNLSVYGAIKIQKDGGVSLLEIEINSENFESVLKMFKTKLIENARAFDAKDDRMGNNPNQMNIQSVYADMDLDANGMETEYQAAMEELVWFINQYLLQKGEGDFSKEKVSFVFNRDIMVNEGEIITNISNSRDILSKETLVEHHPFVTDAKAEMERIHKEEQENMEKALGYNNAFPENNPDEQTNQ